MVRWRRCARLFCSGIRSSYPPLSVDGVPFFVTDEFPEYGGLGPKSLGGSPVTFNLNVPDCDARFQRAVDAGCTVAMPLQDMFWGDRCRQVVDPNGSKWADVIDDRQVTPEELAGAIASMG